MPQQEFVELEAGEQKPQLTLHFPGESAGDKSLPAVLICPPLPGAARDLAPLMGELTSRLVDAGLAVAQLDRPENETAPDTADALIDEASAAFRWLLLREGLDADRIGVLGADLAAITAACLSARTDRINRLCLLSGMTNDLPVSRLARPDSGPPLLDPADLVESFLESFGTLSPAKDIATHDRPTLIIHAAADEITPPESVAPYIDSIETAGRTVDCDLIALADHEFTHDEVRPVCLARVTRFFLNMTAPKRD